MGKWKEPVTAAVRVLRHEGVEFQGHPYRYLEGGGTAWFARETGVAADPGADRPLNRRTR